MRDSITFNNASSRSCRQTCWTLTGGRAARRFVSEGLRRFSLTILMTVIALVSSTSWSSIGLCDYTERSLAPSGKPFESHTKAVQDGMGLNSSLRFLPITLKDGSRLTLITPDYWVDIAKGVSQEITRTHQQLTALLGSAPPFRTSIRIMEEYYFYELTGAPSWTNAMFFRGEIIIPLDSSKPIDMENLRRSVKHEYSHAVLSAMSAGAIPGWIDEGLAQWIEGDENPVLKATLKRYLADEHPISLHLLQGGFTKLPNTMVPAAYAESLIAIQAVIKAYGTEKIGLYLKLLRNGESSEKAFHLAFGISLSIFESKLRQTLISWSQTAPRSSPSELQVKTSPGRAQPKGPYPRLAYPAEKSHL